MGVGWCLLLLALMTGHSHGLSPHLTASHYDLRLSLDLDGTNITEYQGEVKITFHSKATIGDNVRKLVLNSMGLKFDFVELFYNENRRTARIPHERIRYTPKEETVLLLLDQAMQRSSSFNLTIRYRGSIPGNPGFSKTQQVSSASSYLTTHLYPLGARHLYPCFDEPGQRASFDLTLHVSHKRQKPPTIVSGLKIKAASSPTPESQQLIVQYYRTPAIPPYGLFFTIGNYELVPGFPVWVTTGTSIVSVNQDAAEALQSDLIKQLAHNVDSSLAVVGVPNLPYQALSAYGIAPVKENVLISNEMSGAGLRSASLTILKAILGCFYGITVSPVTWEHVWLTESISTYLATVALQQLSRWKSHPDLTMWYIQQEALLQTWSDSSSPIVPKELKSLDSVLHFLKDPALKKGAAVMATLQSLLNEPKKVDSLVAILKDTRYSTLNTVNFLDMYEKANGLDTKIPKGINLTRVMSSWLNSSGYPLVSVTKNNQNFISVSQSRFSGDTQSKVNPQSWYLPLSYQSLEGDNPLFWLTLDKISLDVKVTNGSYIVFNSNHAGVYRVKYDKELWRELSQVLSNFTSQTAVSPLVRATVINDGFAAAQAEQLSYTDLLMMLNYITQEGLTEAPWVAAVHNLRKLWYSVYSLGREDMKVDFKNYLTDLLRSSYYNLGLGLGDPSLELGILRNEITRGMCDFDDELCLQDTEKAYKDYITPRKTIIAKDMEPVIRCKGLQKLQSEDQEKMLLKELYSPELSDSEKRTAFYLLACPSSTNSSFNAPINQLLHDVLINKTVNLDGKDAQIALEAVVSHAELVDNALKFFFNNYNELRPNIDIHSRVNIIKLFGTVAATELSQQLMQNWTKNGRSIPEEIHTSAQIALDSIQYRRTFFRKHEQEIWIGLLHGVTPHPGSTTVRPPSTQPSSHIPHIPTPTATPKPSSATTLHLPALLLHLSIFYLAIFR